MGSNMLCDMKVVPFGLMELVATLLGRGIVFCFFLPIGLFAAMA